jgi:pyrroline-5-carboxylate reductase
VAIKNKNLAFIGGGNLTNSLIQGLTSAGIPPKNIVVSDIDLKKLKKLHSQFKINITQNTPEAISRADILFLAVKPQVLKNVCFEIADSIQKSQPIVVSVAAGICFQDLKKWLGVKAKVVRSMPNLAAAVGKGMTGLFASNLTNVHKKLVSELFKLIGEIIWIKNENLMDAITSVCGSGPGIIFLLIESLQKAACELGFSDNDAKTLVLQTMLGSSTLALKSKHSARVLREQVTSPHGTTEAAIKILQKRHIEKILREALTAAVNRAADIAKQMR